MAVVNTIMEGTVSQIFAFQGKHAYLSNHHPCTIKHHDKTFSSSEQEFQYTRATENNEGGVARKIYVENDVKEITKLATDQGLT